MNRVPLVYRPGPLAWLGVLAATCLIVYAFQQILWLVVPFLLALLTYYVLAPWQYRLLMAGVSTNGAALLVAGGAFVFFGLLLFFGWPWLAREIAAWPETFGRYLDGGLRFLKETARLLERHFPVLAKARLSAALAEQVAAVTGGFAKTYLPVLAMNVLAWAPSLLLAPVLTFFMLRDGGRFKKFLGRAVPNAYFERTLCLLDRVDRTARVYFIGLLQLTVIDTLCLAAGLWWLGLSKPLLLGLLTAVLAWVPFIGSVVGCLLVVLVAATDFPGSPQMAYGAVMLFVIVRLLDDFLFMPLTVGKSLRLHPLLSVLMIFIGGAVAGVPGLMFVLPVLGVTLVLGEAVGGILADQRLRERHRHARRLSRLWAQQGLPVDRA